MTKFLLALVTAGVVLFFGMYLVNRVTDTGIELERQRTAQVRIQEEERTERVWIREQAAIERAWIYERGATERAASRQQFAMIVLVSVIGLIVISVVLVLISPQRNNNYYISSNQRYLDRPQNQFPIQRYRVVKEERYR